MDDLAPAIGGILLALASWLYAKHLRRQLHADQKAKPDARG